MLSVLCCSLTKSHVARSRSLFYPSTTTNRPRLTAAHNMAFILCCFSEGPIDDDKFPEGQKFQTALDDAACQNPSCCLAGGCCPCCASWKLRRDFLQNDMNKYTCCQSEVEGCCCCKPGKMQEANCPHLCLCLETFCCTTLSISSTRSAVMRHYHLSSDVFDRKLIRCTNCLMWLSCLCRLCDCDGAQELECLVNCLTYTVMGCMAAQVNHELEYRNHNSSTDVPVAQGYIVDEGAPLLKPIDMNRDHK